jgi:RNA polymerase sigma-70 factor (ECF subfamily)
MDDITRQEFLTRLFAEHRGGLFRFIRRRIRAKSNAPDLVQEVYVRLLKVKDTEAIRNPVGYLYTVADNLLKERGVRERNEVSHLPYCDEWSMHMRLGELRSLEAELEEEQMMERLDSTIETLPRPIHTAMVLKYREGLKYDEIAAVMHKSPSAVKKYLAAGIALCRLGTETKL